MTEEQVIPPTEAAAGAEAIQNQETLNDEAWRLVHLQLSSEAGKVNKQIKDEKTDKEQAMLAYHKITDLAVNEPSGTLETSLCQAVAEENNANGYNLRLVNENGQWKPATLGTEKAVVVQAITGKTQNGKLTVLLEGNDTVSISVDTALQAQLLAERTTIASSFADNSPEQNLVLDYANYIDPSDSTDNMKIDGKNIDKQAIETRLKETGLIATADLVTMLGKLKEEIPADEPEPPAADGTAGETDEAKAAREARNQANEAKRQKIDDLTKELQTHNIATAKDIKKVLEVAGVDLMAPIREAITTKQQELEAKKRERDALWAQIQQMKTVARDSSDQAIRQKDQEYEEKNKEVLILEQQVKALENSINTDVIATTYIKIQNGQASADTASVFRNAIETMANPELDERTKEEQINKLMNKLIEDQMTEGEELTDEQKEVLKSLLETIMNSKLALGGGALLVVVAYGLATQISKALEEQSK